jgi:hypothetical protein
MRDLNVESSGFEIGCKAEVLEIGEAVGHAFCQLKDPIDGYDGRIDEMGLDIGKDAREMVFYGAGELLEGFESATGGPGEPPFEGSRGVLRNDVLQSLPQDHGAAEFGVGFTESMTHFLSPLCACPGVSSHAPKPSAFPSFLWPKALINASPERLPRRAVRGLGRTAPIKPVRFTNSIQRGAIKLYVTILTVLLIAPLASLFAAEPAVPFPTVSLPICKSGDSPAMAGGSITNQSQTRTIAETVPRPGQEAFYVSPDGNDNAVGSFHQPFRTLGKAQESVRRRIKENPTINLNVILKDGTYPLERTLVFTAEDCPAKEGRIVWKAANAHQAKLIGAVALEGWKQNSDIIPEIPEALRERVYSTPLPVVEGNSIAPKVLFAERTRLKRARTQGFEPTDAFGYPKDEELGLSNALNNRVNFPAGAMKNWSNLADAELITRPTFGWVMNILGIASVNETERVAYTTIPATYPIKPLSFQQYDVFYQQYFKNEKASCWVENVFEAMRKPGDWVVDSNRGKIYLVTDGQPPDDVVYAPFLKELVALRGDDENGQIIRNLVFRDIAFSYTERDTWTKDDIGLQHDWEMYNKANAVFRLQGAENCLVDGCAFLECGSSAIRLDGYCRNIRVINNTIKNVGGAGVSICGYGPGYRDVSHDNQISNNHIQHCGTQYWMSPGVFVSQSGGNLISHNLIHDTPYCGIIVSGVRHFLSTTGRGGSCLRRSTAKRLSQRPTKFRRWSRGVFSKSSSKHSKK